MSSAASVPPATSASRRFSWSISSLYGRLGGGVRCSEVLVAGVSAMVAAFVAQTSALRGDYELKPGSLGAVAHGVLPKYAVHQCKVVASVLCECSASQSRLNRHVGWQCAFDWG